MWKKIDKAALVKTLVRYAATILILAILVLLVLANCDIRSSADVSNEADGKKLSVGEWKDYEFSYLSNGTEGVYTDDSLDYNNYKVAAEGDCYQLLYHEKDGSIIVRDKRSEGYSATDKSTGYMWSSILDPSQNDIDTLNELWRRKISSLIIINVYNSKKNTSDGEYQVFMGGDYKGKDYNAAKMKIDTLSNGIEVTYAYEAQYIQVTVRITLENDVLRVEIPQEKIVEQGNYKITKIDVMPMFGCVRTNKTDGYVFYPDGSGAISYFSKDNVRENGTTYKWCVYSDAAGETQKLGESSYRPSYTDINESIESGVKNVSLPVFGIRESDEHACFAIIENGSADATVCYDPGGYVIAQNRIYSSFTYRRGIDLSTIGGTIQEAATDSAKFETEIQKKDVTVLYNFLGKNSDQESADYSGMAATYRKYLLQKNLLNDVISDTDKMQVGVDLFMGIYEEQALADNYVAMTTYGEAEDILKELSEAFGDKVQISTALYGWQKGGYGADPLVAKAASGLGGNGGLKKLVKTAKNLNVNLALNVNPVDLYTGKYTARTDAVYLASKLPMQAQGVYARSYKNMFNGYLDDYTSYAEDLGVSLNIERLGRIFYGDYNKNNALTEGTSFTSRNTAYAYLTEQLASLSAKVKYWTESNLYAIQSANRITDLDYTHSQYDISNEAVPFYQMVVHGYLPYSSVPGNLSHDITWMELKWAEYGYMPYFLLSDENAADLKYTDANWLYSCKYSEWKQDLLNAVSHMLDNHLDEVWNATMLKHTRMDKLVEVYAVEYDNGKVLYVNYSAGEYTVTTEAGNTVTVPSMSYVLLDKN